MFSLANNLPKTTSNFCPSKFLQEKYVQTKWIFRPSKLHQIKLSRNTVDISTREITLNTLKSVNGNNVDYSTIEIKPKKIRENNMVFSTSKLHRKKYVEIT